jgi:hypothetical protein
MDQEALVADDHSLDEVLDAPHVDEVAAEELD